ncbi:unnamed protein product [Lymnaea stagnalis]|uniref:Uncharacterized protein n=1 Tax=Lymnaea stagnalis TaxID=6523 RepID=A0AAV2I2Y7_LYMST
MMTSDYRRRSWVISILLVALVCDYVSAGLCPAVDSCIGQLAESMQNAGHVPEEYCPVIAQVIACLKKGECSTETQSHKDAELRHFQKDASDASCNAGEKLVPGISMLLIFYTVWRVLCQQ